MLEAAVTVRNPHKHETNVKETIESIVVAFILAFIFRAFVVEAFLIPTGSMAPTLLGAHLRMECPDCGNRFVIDDPTPRGQQGSDADSVYRGVVSVPCGQCGNAVQSTKPMIHRGDRILVLKYLYNFQKPRRWDVVVFKSPDPPQDDYQVNYIKRLVGLPGESLAILDGDIYTRPDQAGLIFDKSDLAGQMAGFQIQRKPRLAQDALWRLVHDNDFVARRGAEAVWQPQSGNEFKLIDHGRIIEFDGLGGASTLTFVPERIRKAQMLMDFTPYNVMRGPPRNQVSDLKLSVCYERLEGDGPFMLKLRKYDDWFIARVLPDKVILLRNDKEIGSHPLANGRPVQIDLINADYRVTVRINGEDVLHTGDSYSPDLRALPDLIRRETRPADVQIAAENHRSSLSHISIWRDAHYYLNGVDDHNAPHIHARPEAPIQLKSGEFFVLGDNPAVSADARGWASPIDLPDEESVRLSGIVPERFMIGKAFFVYWPAGYRPLELPVGIIPNFGEMRFIH